MRPLGVGGDKYCVKLRQAGGKSESQYKLEQQALPQYCMRTSQDTAIGALDHSQRTTAIIIPSTAGSNMRDCSWDASGFPA